LALAVWIAGFSSEQDMLYGLDRSWSERLVVMRKESFENQNAARQFSFIFGVDRHECSWEQACRLLFQAGLPIPALKRFQQHPGSANRVFNLSFPPLLQYGLAMGFLCRFFAVITALLKKINLKWAGLLAAALALCLRFLACFRIGKRPG